MTHDQEAEDMAAAVLHRMTQRGITAREWGRQSRQWEARGVVEERDAGEARMAQLTLAMDEAVQTYANELTTLRTAADHAVANLRAIKSLNDDPTIEQIVDETADALAAALEGVGNGE